MAKKAPITETVLQILHDAAGTLSVDEIAAQLEARLPGASANYKNSVRNTLQNNRMGPLIKLADGRIGLAPRLVKGAVVRHVFEEDHLAERELPVGPDLANLFSPGGMLNKNAALRLELAGGQQLIGRFSGTSYQGVFEPGPVFWDWLEAQGAAPGDSLIVTATDPEERRYAIAYEPAAARDEAVIADRNDELLSAAAAVLRRGRGRVPLWEITAALNASGLYHHPTPPDPIETIWSEQVWGPVQDEYGVDFPLTGGDHMLFGGLERLLGGLAPAAFGQPEPGEHDPDGPITIDLMPEDLPPGVSPQEFRRVFEEIYTPNGLRPIPAAHPLADAITAVAARSGLPSPTGSLYKASHLQSLFGSDDETLDWIDEGIALGMVDEDADYDPMLDDDDDLGADPPDLPRAYARTGAQRKPQPSPKGKRGPVKTYVLRLSVDYDKSFWRDIEIAEDQNFEDLHLIIQQALGWDDDHLYSFFMNRRTDDIKAEIGSPWSNTYQRTYHVTIGGVGLKPRQKFVYLFDYGDEHLFNLQVLKINNAAPRGAYPKVVAKEGQAPSQYFDNE